MEGFPTWWLYLTAAFVVVNLIFFAVLTFLLVKLYQGYAILAPKIERITDRVESIAVKVDDVATTTRETLAVVSEKAKSVATSAESIADTAGITFGKYGSAVRAIMMALKVFRMVQQVRGSRTKASKKSRSSSGGDRNENALP